MGTRIEAVPAVTRADAVRAVLDRIADLSRPANRAMHHNGDTLRRIHNLARAARVSVAMKNPA